MTKKKNVHKRGSFLKNPKEIEDGDFERMKLYELSVQSPKQEILNIEVIFKQVLNKSRVEIRKPVTLREDFCGSGILCIEWTNSRFDRSSYGLDLDQKVIDIANKKLVEKCANSINRVFFYQGNVLSTEHDYSDKNNENIEEEDIENQIPRCDIIVAFNYACFFFKDRKDLIKYLKLTLNRLNTEEKGVFILDIFGGKKAFLKQNRLIRKFEAEQFEYYFEIVKHNFLNNHLKGALNFKINNERWLKHAFTYDFRVYSLQEIKDALLEAGFNKVYVWYCNSENTSNSTSKKFDDNNFVFLEDDSAFEEHDYWSMYVAATL